MQSNYINTVLIYPKVGDEAYAVPHMPLSVLSVASAVQQKGYSVKIIDQRVEGDWKKAITDSISGSLLCFGISSMTGPQIGHAIEIAKYIREIASDIPIVWGGVHASILPEQTLQSYLVDIVVIKEGEEAFFEVLSALKNKSELKCIKGVGFKDSKGTIHINRAGAFCDLNKYAFLDYSLLDIKEYQKQGQERVPRAASVSLYTSRGCPFKCTFCYNNSFHDSTWRGQSVDTVINSLSRLHNQGIKNIILCDEYFFQDIERARSICQALTDREMQFRFFYANCRLDQILKMKEEDIQLFHKSGFKDFFVGIESGSLKMLKSISKGITDTSNIEKAAAKLVRSGMSIQFSFMLGLPEESIEDMKQTLKLMVELLKKFPSCFVPGAGKFIPFPGTEAYNKTVELGWHPPKYFEEWKEITKVNQKEWLGDKVGTCAESALFLTSSFDTKINPRANNLLEMIRKLYSKIARWKAKHGYIEFVPEYYIMKSHLGKIFKKKRK